MPVYIISDVTVKDRNAMEEYRTRAAPTIALYGGRYLVRGGEAEALEGTWLPRMFVVADKVGGQVMGAFDGNTMVGFALSHPAGVPAPWRAMPPTTIIRGCPGHG